MCFSSLFCSSAVFLFLFALWCSSTLVTISTFLNRISVNLVPCGRFVATVSNARFKNMYLMAMAGRCPVRAATCRRNCQSIQAMNCSAVRRPFLVLMGRSSYRITSPYNAVYYGGGEQLCYWRQVSRSGVMSADRVVYNVCFRFINLA